MTVDVRKRLEEEAQRLSHRDPRQRVEGIRRVTALAIQLPLAERDAAIPILEGAAEDSEAFVRWNLAFALGEIGHEHGIHVLERLSEDEHANVRFRVALALALIGHERALQTLKRLVTDTYKIGEHYPVRAFAALALSRFRQHDAVRALAASVEDADPVVRWHAAVALGDIGLESGVELLAKLVDDPIPFVRAHVAIALAQIGDRAGLPFLERLTQDSMPRVAQIGRASLELLQDLMSVKEA